MSQRQITLTMPQPNARQLLMLRDTEHRYIIFGGARGGGKSWAVRWKAILLCLKYPGIKVLIVRQTYPELLDNHINPHKLMLNGVARYNGAEHEMRFANGSVIKYRYCAKDDDLLKFYGQEYDVVFVDEATHLSEYQLKAIDTCVRGVNDFPKRMYMTCNPGGKGHQYIKRLKDGRFTPDEDPAQYVFFQSLVTDNKALMRTQPDYIKQLQKLPPKLREAHLYGNWDIYEGQFFEDFVDDPKHYADRKNTHVIAPFEPPSGWRIYRSFDWGYGKPFSCGWWAVDYDGVIYRILELYGCKKDEPNTGVKWIDDKIFAEIARMEREHPWLQGKDIHGVADPAIWDASGDGVSTADTARKHRIYFDKGNHDRIPGWMQCHYRLAFDQNGYPMMYVFKNCEAFIRTIPLLVYDEHMDEDLDSDGEDHVADEWRYFCMSRPITPRALEEAKPIMIDPLNMYKKRRH